MTITWLGQNCFKIEGSRATVLVDPIDPKSGAKMPKVAVDILLLPRPYPEKSLGFLKSESFVVDTPGEFESKGVFIQGEAHGAKGEIIFRFTVDGVNFAYLGGTAVVDNSISDFLDSVDVLFVPVGGGEALCPVEAVGVVNSIEPRIVIPMRYKAPGLSGLQPVDKFFQAMGVKNPERVKKLNLAKKDLPNEETKLIIFE